LSPALGGSIAKTFSVPASHTTAATTVAVRRLTNDPVTRRARYQLRGPLVARVFELYATGDYSLSALRTKAREIGLTHRLGNRPMTKSEIHRMLQNPIYTGDFRWLGKIHHGSHTPLISHDTFERVQAAWTARPRRWPSPVSGS
jgi:hypothetical protein